VIYRTAKGQLRELSSSADGSTWNNTAIRVPGLVPPPAGQLSAYALASGKRHVIYRGTSGHLHELSLSAKDPANNHWHHMNLTSLLAQPIARCDPSVTVVDNAPHIVYLDHTSRARELWFDGEWRHHPLPFAPRPASNVVISSTPAAFHVSYRTMFGVPCEQLFHAKRPQMASETGRTEFSTVFRRRGNPSDSTRMENGVSSFE